MSLGNDSSTSSTSNYYTSNTNTNIQGVQGSAVNGVGDFSRVTITDNGAVNDALGFATTTSANANSTINNALNKTDNLATLAINNTGDLAKTSMNNANDLATKVINTNSTTLSDMISAIGSAWNNAVNAQNSALSSVVAADKNSMNTIQSAYSNAKTVNNNYLVAAGIIAIALVALKVAA